MTASQLSRRSVLKAVGLAGGAFAAGVPLSACGGNGSAGGGGGNASFLTWDTTSGSPLYTVAENWAKGAGKTLDIQSVPGDDYDTKLRTVLSSGSVRYQSSCGDIWPQARQAVSAHCLPQPGQRPRVLNVFQLV